MKIIKTNRFLLGMIVLVSTASTAQTVNTGELFIIPGSTMSTVGALHNMATGDLVNDGLLYIYNDYQNDGMVSFMPGNNGSILFAGAANQKIEGAGISEFQNVVFNNAGPQPAIELHNEISINGNANFSRGIIDNDSFGGMVTFERMATIANASKDSHVDGRVKKNGDLAFRFPVGHKGEHREAGIEALSDVMGGFTWRFLHENSDNLYPHSSKSNEIEIISDREYWVFEKVSGTADAIITLSWDEDSTTPGHIITNPDDIHVVGWDIASNTWVDKGGVVDKTNKTVTTPVAVSGSNIFTLAKVLNALPCKDLVIYNAVSPNGDGMNDYFRIDGLDSCTNGSNSVQIFNRWGVKVFETDNYGVNGNVFAGYSDGRTTIGNTLLPSGTYFYIINFNYQGTGNTNNRQTKSGYLYLN